MKIILSFIVIVLVIGIGLFYISHKKKYQNKTKTETKKIQSLEGYDQKFFERAKVSAFNSEKVMGLGIEYRLEDVFNDLYVKFRNCFGSKIDDYYYDYEYEYVRDDIKGYAEAYKKYVAELSDGQTDRITHELMPQFNKIYDTLFVREDYDREEKEDLLDSLVDLLDEIIYILEPYIEEEHE